MKKTEFHINEKLRIPEAHFLYTWEFCFLLTKTENSEIKCSAGKKKTVFKNQYIAGGPVTEFCLFVSVKS